MLNVVSDLAALEELAGRGGFVQRLHPAVKIGAAFAYIVTVISFDRHSLGQMTPFLLYPVIIGALVSLPLSLNLRRLLPALPFCVPVGISNIIFETKTAFTVRGINVSFGVISFSSLLFRALLCVEALVLLSAATPVYSITMQLRRFRLPSFLVMLFEMTYRYIGVLETETQSLRTAYLLRGGSKRGIDLRHAGSFTGSLFLRGMARTEHISSAMKLRGYSEDMPRVKGDPVRARDLGFLALVILSCIFFRFINVPLVIGKLCYALFM